MRVFPRINYRRMGAKGGRRRRGPGRARTEPRTPLLLAVPCLLLAASLLAYAYAGPGALLVLASAAAALAAAQGVALRRLSGRRPLHLSAQDGEDRRFLLDLRRRRRRVRRVASQRLRGLFRSHDRGRDLRPRRRARGRMVRGDAAARRPDAGRPQGEVTGHLPFNPIAQSGGVDLRRWSTPPLYKHFKSGAHPLSTGKVQGI